MSSMFHVPDYKFDYCQRQQETFKNVLTDLPRPWSHKIRVCSSLQPRPQDKKHQKLVRHNDSSSKVNIDLYLFQPSFHPGRTVWCVWCLESAAALPILVHSVIKNRLKVTVKYQPLTPQKWWQSYTWRPNTFNGMAIFCTQQKTVSCCWFVDDAVKILRGCQDQDLRHHPHLYCTHHHQVYTRQFVFCWLLLLVQTKPVCHGPARDHQKRQDDGDTGKERVEKCAGCGNSVIDTQTPEEEQYRDGHSEESFQLIIERWSYANPTIVVQYNH